MVNVFFGERLSTQLAFLLSGKLVNMADDLATLSAKINTTEEKIEKLERHIANNDFAGTPYDDRAEAKAALKDLRAKEAALQNEKVALQNKEVELLKKENLLLQQQQQTGAGTSMLPVRLAIVIFLLPRSCCMLANLVAFRVCLVACIPCTAAACCCQAPIVRCALEKCYAVQSTADLLTCVSLLCCVCATIHRPRGTRNRPSNVKKERRSRRGGGPR
jgi:hypothetical protein